MNIKTKTSKKMIGMAMAGVLALNAVGMVSPSMGGLLQPTEVSAATKASFAKKTLITVKTSNLYTSASSKSKVKSTLKTSVKVTATAEVGSFYKVSYGSLSGYIYKTNLKTYVAPLKGQTISKKYFLTNNSAPLYASYSKTSKIVKVLPYSEKVSSTYKIGDFYKVTHGTKTGYVHKSQLSPFVAPSPTKNPTTKSMDSDKGAKHVAGVMEDVILTTASEIHVGKNYGEAGPVIAMSFDILNKSNGASAISFGSHYKELSSKEKEKFMKDSITVSEVLFGNGSKYAVELRDQALKAMDNKESKIILVDNRTFNLSYDSGFVTIIPV